MILLGLGAPLSPDPPPVGDAVRAGFVDFGPHDVLDAVTGVLVAVQRANWCQKWLGHRRLRPEEHAGLIHATATGRGTHPVPESVRASTAPRRIRERDGGYLLPQAYPEGSPLHPSYPAGHAGIAGAAVTVLKAYFDEDAVITNPVRPDPEDPTQLTTEGVPDELTVGGEINKLATNIAYARSWAGIHYRSDTITGLRIGERIATAVLRDRLHQRPAGAYGSRGSFTFTTFDGTESDRHRRGRRTGQRLRPATVPVAASVTRPVPSPPPDWPSVQSKAPTAVRRGHPPTLSNPRLPGR